MRQGDVNYRVYDVLIGETRDHRYTAATGHVDSAVYRIDKHDGRRKYLGKRSSAKVQSILLAELGEAS